MKRNLLLCLPVLIAISCVPYTPPNIQNVKDVSYFVMDYDVAFNKIMNWLNDNDLLVESTDKNAGLIVAKGSLRKLDTDKSGNWAGSSRYSTVAECGECGLLGNEFPPQRAHLNIIVSKDGNMVKVRVKILFSDLLGEPECREYNCISNGKIERLLFEYLKKY
jgi:hypothetical protein